MTSPTHFPNNRLNLSDPVIHALYDAANAAYLKYGDAVLDEHLDAATGQLVIGAGRFVGNHLTMHLISALIDAQNYAHELQSGVGAYAARHLRAEAVALQQVADQLEAIEGEYTPDLLPCDERGNMRVSAVLGSGELLNAEARGLTLQWAGQRYQITVQWRGLQLDLLPPEPEKRFAYSKGNLLSGLRYATPDEAAQTDFDERTEQTGDPPEGDSGAGEEEGGLDCAVYDVSLPEPLHVASYKADRYGLKVRCSWIDPAYQTQFPVTAQ